MVARTMEYLRSLVRELAKLPTETEWVEFKCNNKDPEVIARNISAISNVAAILNRPKGYLVWGIEDKSHEIIGTDFAYRKAKKGNEELEAWLYRMINPKIDFHFYEIVMEDGIIIVLLEIPSAETEPTKYASTPMIRVGSNSKSLVSCPEKEQELWKHFDTTPHELRLAKINVSEDDVVRLLDFSKYYDVMQMPIPRDRKNIMEDFLHEKFIFRNDAGNYNISNLGALLIGKNIKEFEGLVKRPVRVIRYKGNNRLDGISEREFCAGYAFSHDVISQYIMDVIPQEEILDGSIRHTVHAFPNIAVRELLANSMIHQSLDQRGTSPMVEIFANRIEFSNAGAPLVDINRIVDTVPLSRNENIAGFMHKCGICEERGSGYDKILKSTCKSKLLAPMVINQDDRFTKVVLFGKIPFEMISKEDRIRTCYMQACLAYVEFGAISNSDVREVFDLEQKEKVKASRIIKDTLEAGLIKPLDPDTAPRYMKYIPSWA